MSKLMIQYIEEQAQVISHIIENRQEICKDFVKRYADRQIDRIFLIGSGSSYHSGYMASNFMQNVLGIEVAPQAPSRMQNMDVVTSKNVLFITVSQSGKSTNTESIIHSLMEKGYEVTALTESHRTPVARMANISIEIRCGEEIRGAKTKGVSGSVLTLMLLALELAAAKGKITETAYNETVEKLKKVGENTLENVARCNKWYENCCGPMLKASHLVIVGMEKDYGVAMEGALKLLETVRRPIFNYEFEEFLHGVASMLGENSHMVFFVPNGDKKERFLRLCHYAKERGAHINLLTREPLNGEGDVLTLKSVMDDDLACFEWLIPVQLLSARLSFDSGIDISISDFGRFSKVMGSKIEDKE